MIKTTHLGFPRIGARRELKRALESFWNGNIDAVALQDTAADLRKRHWQLAREAGIDIVPCNDFSLYDHVLDTAVLFDAIPPRTGRYGRPTRWPATSPSRAACRTASTTCARSR